MIITEGDTMILKTEQGDKPRTYLAHGEFKSEQNEV